MVLGRLLVPRIVYLKGYKASSEGKHPALRFVACVAAMVA